MELRIRLEIDSPFNVHQIVKCRMLYQCQLG